MGPIRYRFAIVTVPLRRGGEARPGGLVGLEPAGAGDVLQPVTFTGMPVAARGVCCRAA